MTQYFTQYLQKAVNNTNTQYQYFQNAVNNTNTQYQYHSKTQYQYLKQYYCPSLVGNVYFFTFLLKVAEFGVLHLVKIDSFLLLQWSEENNQ